MGRKLDPPPPPHINMQSRPTGTIPVRIKCCVLVFKRTMPGQRSSEQMCVSRTPQIQTGGYGEGVPTLYREQRTEQHTLQIQLLSVHTEAQGSRMTPDRDGDDDDVTLYLHIYENALFGSLI